MENMQIENNTGYEFSQNHNFNSLRRIKENAHLAEMNINNNNLPGKNFLFYLHLFFRGKSCRDL